MALVGVILRLQINRGQFCEPPPAKLVQLVEDPWLQFLKDQAIGMLHLPVRLWVHHSRPVHAYVVAVAECKEFLARELGAVVGVDRIRDPKPEDNVSKEQNGLLGFNLADGSSLDPFRELVDRY